MAIKRKIYPTDEAKHDYIFKSETMYSQFNLYEDDETFKINPNWNTCAQVEYLGKRKTPVVIIDDFLPNIDRVRELALSAHYSNDEQKMTSSPGMRCIFRLCWDIREVVRPFYQAWYDAELDFDYKFPLSNQNNAFTIIDTQEPMGNIQCWPHIDVAWENGQRIGTETAQHVAGLLYLNTPDECKGGTGLYKNKLLDTHLCKDYDDYKKCTEAFKKVSHRDTNINYEKNDYYELVKEVKMKYNRFVMYPTCMYHHPIYHTDDFTGDTCRMVLGTFA